MRNKDQIKVGLGVLILLALGWCLYYLTGFPWMGL